MGQYEYFGLANRCVGRVLGGHPPDCNIGSPLPALPERVWQALIDRRALAALMMDNDLSRD